MTSRLALFAALGLSLFAAPGTDQYFVVLLKPRPDRVKLTKEDGDRLQAAHMAHIMSMAASGALVAAGPFEDKPPVYSGVFVFKTATIDQARNLAEQDPTVSQKRNDVVIFAWRGPAGIGDEYRRLHAANPQTPEGMGVHPLFLLRGTAGSQHALYMEDLKKQGKVAADGPVAGLPELQAVVIFKRIPDEEARQLMDADPDVKSGALKVEAHRWWSAEHVLP